MSDETEQALKLELMPMDLNLKTKQVFWGIPRNIAILPATVAAVPGALGYTFGQSPQPAPILINLPAPAASK